MATNNGEKTWPRLGRKMAVVGEKKMAVDRVRAAALPDARGGESR
jgi:hypothetical protein